MNDIEVRNATVYLGGREILHDISWTVPAGGRYFILGANGAGKTTLVKMLMGYAWPIYGAGLNVAGNTYGKGCNLVELRKKIALVSPFLQQYMNMETTVLDVVISAFDGTLDLFRPAREEEEERAMDILKKLRAGHLAKQSIYTLSSGEQVKVLIARALLTEPRLVIMDEPSVYLDISGREFLLDSIRDLGEARPDLTMLFITQRIEDILPEFDHGMILKNGRVLTSGSRDEVLSAKHLSEAFELPIRLVKSANGRLWALVD